MKHIDIKSYLEAATASEEAWNTANDKLVEFETKLKELTIIKAQLKILLDNTSMSSSHLRSLIMALEKLYFCMCGRLESNSIHNSGTDPLLPGSHAFVNANDFRSEDK